MKKGLKYLISILVLALVAYNSVYFKKLDEVKAAGTSTAFNASKYAREFYNSKLLTHLDSAVELGQLVAAMKSAPDKAFTDYSHSLDIGNIRYFMVRGEGKINRIGEDDLILDSGVRIATEFVYGNAIRDASGLIKLNEFNSTADFNSVSEEINKIIRTDVLPTIKQNAKPGDMVKFSGAIELNQAHVNLDSLEIIPIKLVIQK